MIFFFRTAVLQKLCDIRFSFKHCNFSHVCVLVKMASKTTTRPIEDFIIQTFIILRFHRFPFMERVGSKVFFSEGFDISVWRDFIPTPLPSVNLLVYH